jgi:hypothetical protein
LLDGPRTARITPKKVSPMPLTFQSVKLAPNANHTFTFSQTVFAYQVGVASFRFSFPHDEDHHVEELSLFLSSNKAGSQNNQVAVQVDGVLKDASGNGMDYPNSYVVVVCLAWVGSSTAMTNLSGPFTVGNGQQSNPIFMPGSNPNVVQSNLSGFLLSFNSKDDHHILGVAAGMGVSTNGNQALLDGTAKMWDSSGNTAVNPTATGNLISSTDSNPGFIIKPWTGEQSSGTVTIPMGKALSGATSLLTSFQVQFSGGDHHLNNIGAGNDSIQVDSNDNQQVVTSGIWAWMGDSSGNTQDMSKSSCSIIAIGFLA